MDAKLLDIFQRQVALQCRYMLFAAQDLNNSFPNKNIERAFYAIQNLLNAGANISKALWGQGGKRTEERKALRDSIGISDNSPLRQVAMRNNFEHFDQRLVKWWEESSNGHMYIDMNMAPKGFVEVGAKPKDIFRNYDPATRQLMFWGQEFNLQELLDEAQRILPKLEAAINKQ